MIEDFENGPEAYGFNPKFLAEEDVAKNMGMTLVEQCGKYANDCCNFNVLRFYFPDYQFKDNMNYFMRDENGTLYHGEKIPDEYWKLKYGDYDIEQEENEPNNGAEEHA